MTLRPVTPLRVTALLASTFLSLGGVFAAEAADTAYNKNNKTASDEVVEKKRMIVRK